MTLKKKKKRNKIHNNTKNISRFSYFLVTKQCLRSPLEQFSGWCSQESTAEVAPSAGDGGQRAPHLWSPVSADRAGEGDGPPPPENPPPPTTRPWLSPTSLRRLQVLHITSTILLFLLLQQHLECDCFCSSRPESRRKRRRPKTSSSRCWTQRRS